MRISDTQTKLVTLIQERGGVSSLSLTGCLELAPLCRVFMTVPEPSGFPLPGCLHGVSRWRVMAAVTSLWFSLCFEVSPTALQRSAGFVP